MPPALGQPRADRVSDSATYLIIYLSGHHTDSQFNPKPPDGAYRGPPAPGGLRDRKVELGPAVESVHGLRPIYRPPNRGAPVDNTIFCPRAGCQPSGGTGGQQELSHSPIRRAKAMPGLNHKSIAEIARLWGRAGHHSFPNLPGAAGSISAAGREISRSGWN